LKGYFCCELKNEKKNRNMCPVEGAEGLDTPFGELFQDPGR
jgi:hypothetical protein